MALSNSLKKPVLTAIAVYLLIEIIGFSANMIASYGFIGAEQGLLLKGIHRVVLLCATLGALYYYRDQWTNLWLIKTWSKTHTAVCLGVLCLFVANNYFMAHYNGNPLEQSQALRATLWWSLLVITISSTYEELLYRGFVQSYIDRHAAPTPPIAGLPFTTGNCWATSIFFVRHLGFFVVFDFLFACTGLVLVLVFSLVAGWLRSTAQSLWVCIALHILCNWIHIALHASVY